MWYEGTYSCGHKGQVKLYGKKKEREWRAEKIFEGICDDCKEKERQEKNKKALELSKEYEFPELIGSEKQIAWANTIRLDFYTRCEQKKIVSDDLITEHLEAKFWIDNRYFIANDIEKFVDESTKKSEREKEKKRLLDEDTVFPTELKYAGVVEIVNNNGNICLFYPKDKDFIELVKKYNFKWDDVWCRHLTKLTGDFSDRAAEIGHVLLKNSFAICIHDKEVLEKAINGNFLPECKRWIMAEPDDSLLKIYWVNRDNYLYSEARRIKTSKWEKPYVTVDISHYKDVQKFAKENDFRFTNEASEKIKDYVEAVKKARKVEEK